MKLASGHLATTNPALNGRTFAGMHGTRDATAIMTLRGAVEKTLLLLAIAVGSASITWSIVAQAGSAEAMNARFEGIATQAVAVTFAVLFCLLIIHRLELVKLDDNVRMTIAASAGGIAMVYLGTWVLGAAGLPLAGALSGGPLGLLFGAFVAVVASLNMLLQFDVIHRGVAGRAPKQLEWYAAFGLMVALVWLYAETLRLLGRLRG